MHSVYHDGSSNQVGLEIWTACCGILHVPSPIAPSHYRGNKSEIQVSLLSTHGPCGNYEAKIMESNSLLDMWVVLGCQKYMHHTDKPLCYNSTRHLGAVHKAASTAIIYTAKLQLKLTCL